MKDLIKTWILIIITLLIFSVLISIIISPRIGKKDKITIDCLLRRGEFIYSQTSDDLIYIKNGPYILSKRTKMWPIKYYVEDIGYIYVWDETATIIDSVMNKYPYPHLVEANHIKITLPDCK